MAAAFDLKRLPATVRTLVVRALANVEAAAEAIDALEEHLCGASNCTDALIALAVLTYEEAAQLVLSRIAEASERALSLLDRAVDEGAGGAALERLRVKWSEALERERARERSLLKQLARGRARPRDVVELAHRLIVRGEDDELASELLRSASAVRSEPPPPSFVVA